MQSSALDMVRDAQARAIARARLMRDDSRVNSREWHDANVVVVDLEEVGKLLDGVGEAVARPVDVGAAASPPKGYTPPAPQPAPATHATGPRTRRDCADAGCPVCKATIAADPTAAADQLGAGAVAADLLAVLFGARRAPAARQEANGVVGVTDTAG